MKLNPSSARAKDFANAVQRRPELSTKKIIHSSNSVSSFSEFEELALAKRTWWELELQVCKDNVKHWDKEFVNSIKLVLFPVLA